MALRLDDARDTIPGHVLTGVPSLLRPDGGPLAHPPGCRHSPHPPMLPSRAGRQQGKSRYLVPHNGPVQAKGALQPPSDSITAFPARPSSCLGSNSLLVNSSCQTQGTTAPRCRRGGPPWSHYLLSHTKSSQRWEYSTPCPTPGIIQRVCPSLGARLTPLPVIASPFTLASAALPPPPHRHQRRPV